MATKKSAKKTYPTKSGKPSSTPPSKRWSAKVTTDSTHPTPGIFNASAQAIADDLAKPSVSPKGPGQGMQMLSFYENRAGKNLSAERKHTLDHAKDILREKEGKPAAKKSAKKSLAKKSTTQKSPAKKKARS
jgi:tRNA(adenine34) deaminase